MGLRTSTQFKHVSYLWDEKKAASLKGDEVALLIYRSNLLGADLRLTNYGGGNTSCKAMAKDPLTGEEKEVMWVKGSGGDLGTLKKNGLAALHVDRLRSLKNLYRGIEYEDEMVELFNHCIYDLDSKAPSIDTPLHGFLPFKHIDHLHPDAAIAIAAAKDGERITKELFNKCQEVRLGNNRTQHVRTTEKPFVFRGLLKCAVSGRRVSCDLKKGKFVYLMCRDPENPDKILYVPENQVLEQIREVFKSFHLPENLIAALTEHLKSGHEAEKDFHMDAVKSLQKEYVEIRDKLNILLEMRLDKSITKNEYDIKAQSLKERQLEINIMSKNHENGDDSFKITVEGLFSIASTAYEIFESSKIEEKRQLIGFVFSKLALKGAKLEYTLRNPFPLMVGKHSYQEWSGR